MAITLATPKNPSSQLKTVLRYFELIKVLDIVELDKLFADDFVQSTRPLSLGVPSRTKEEDVAFLQALAEKIEGRRIEVGRNYARAPPRARAPSVSSRLLGRIRWLTARLDRLPCLT